jgi:hypothetical protein
MKPKLEQLGYVIGDGIPLVSSSFTKQARIGLGNEKRV